MRKMTDLPLDSASMRSVDLFPSWLPIFLSNPDTLNLVFHAHLIVDPSS